MLTLDYQLSTVWNVDATGADRLAVADEVALRYRVLLGDIVFKGDGWDFSTNWGWVPIVDFAISMKQIADVLLEHDFAETSFEFTESSASIGFRRNGDIVLISSNYAEGEGRVPLVSLKGDIDSFVRRVVRELPERHPSLRENKLFGQLLLGESKRGPD